MFPDTNTNAPVNPKEWIDEQDRLALKAFKNWKKEILKEEPKEKPTAKDSKSSS